MVDALSTELAEKRLTSDRLELTIGYDIECLTRPDIRDLYRGRVRTDRYGRRIPWPAHGKVLIKRSASMHMIMDAVTSLYDEIINPTLLIRRITLAAHHLITEEQHNSAAKQMSLFSAEETAQNMCTEAERTAQEKETALQQALVAIKKIYGKNAILRGANLVDGATARLRNSQIGGHKA